MSAQPFLRRSLFVIALALCLHPPLRAEEKQTVPKEVQEQFAHAAELQKQGNYAEAEKEFRAVAAVMERAQDAIAALELAGQSALAQRHYDQALVHYHAAAALTDEKRDPREWARVQYSIAGVYDAYGQFFTAALVLRRVAEIQSGVLDPKYPDFWPSRNGLPITVESRDEAAGAEKEFRAILAIRQRIHGPKHADTLATRNKLAAALVAQGKFAEAEEEIRAVLASSERNFGAAHYSVFRSCYNLALVLRDQNKLKEALLFAQRAEKDLLSVLGPGDPDSKAAKALREQIEADIKKQ